MTKLLKLFFFTIIIFNNIAFAKETDFYIGIESKIVKPVVSKFQHKNSKTEIILKKSSIYSGKIGYIIYPQIAIEFLETYQPTYLLHYVLPQQNLSNGLTIPPTLGNAKVLSNTYMLNLIDDLEKIKTFTALVILGGGNSTSKS
ncbi:hypothetical protein A1E_05020 [Rickettsia canadensis str. McKiel]|uniref:Uncharacterized protein n=1 Tax=Rickettsia canadensis (strain McKiel) TaxID=293613 RepID=A8EZY7_RICCK|nr:hypothetical protein A1E_05020 [Rickettsia canadensis str. McKiel]